MEHPHDFRANDSLRAELKHLRLVHQHKQNSMLWLKPQSSHWQSSCKRLFQEFQFKSVSEGQHRDQDGLIRGEDDGFKVRHVVQLKACHIQVKRMWTQDIFNEGVISLETGGHSPESIICDYQTRSSSSSGSAFSKCQLASGQKFASGLSAVTCATLQYITFSW